MCSVKMGDDALEKRPGKAVRGSESGRPIMVLLDILGQRWTLRILWELRHGPATFRALQTRCESVSPTILNRRLKELRALLLVCLEQDGYRLTKKGEELGHHFAKLDQWAQSWSSTL
jgi:DNA-binding HxlR family transcriptional regulator